MSVETGGILKSLFSLANAQDLLNNKKFKVPFYNLLHLQYSNNKPECQKLKELSTVF